ncbi:hypothetical protein Nepgr_009960 [Nepenthes gracilis]|uniref:PROP1-like PPR domain-containing protein n=1 Tax=Nepenthes gracilis TaxID=150966 RepID=A0AAD3SBE3_NEPGR|nr:hypothetical protein Nepgr_009960 [Nepenthes gracilis]
MWALRRASAKSIKVQGLRSRTVHTCDALDSASGYVKAKLGNSKGPEFTHVRWSTFERFYRTVQIPARFSLGSCSLSSQSGARSGGEEEDNLEDGFSELETSEISETLKDSHLASDNELLSEPELSDDNDDVEEEASENELISGTETDVTERISQEKRFPSALFKAIMDDPTQSVNHALDKFMADGMDLNRSEISHAMLNLRKRRMYMKALQLLEWLESNKRLDFVERDYASRVDLIAKVRGLQKAESYMDSIPKSCSGEVVYRTFLANCVAANNVRKAEEVFNKMKDLDFPATAFACNQLLLLYKRIDKKKIADVLLFMEKENVRPSPFTYKILIDTKGQSNDIAGMDQIVDTMKAEGVEPDFRTQAILARHYAAGGLKEKAGAVLKDMEGGNLKSNRGVCRFLLPLYADLGNADEVGRIWNICESKPTLGECLAAVEAWGKLKKIEEAEDVFERMLKTWKKLSSRHYSVMLKVYTNHKMLSKGKDLVKKMGDSGCHIGPLTWDALVKLYVEAGEVEKADVILQKAVQHNQGKPLFSSYMAIMEKYAKRADVHNAEKMFHRMRQAGYVSRARPYQTLLEAYMNAKAPAYGIRERMKADNIFPNKSLAAQLAQVDAFRKTAVSDLLD